MSAGGLSPALLALQGKLRSAIVDDAPSVATFWAVVTAVNAGPPKSVDVKISGSSSTSHALRYDRSLTPAVGDVVWGVRVGQDFFVVGARA